MDVVDDRFPEQTETLDEFRYEMKVFVGWVKERQRRRPTMDVVDDRFPEETETLDEFRYGMKLLTRFVAG